jgi:trimeric autotransporter adhesin
MKKLCFFLCLWVVLSVTSTAQQCFYPGNDTCWRTTFVGNGVAQTSRIIAMAAKPDGLYCLFESPIGVKLTGGAPSLSVVNKWNGSYWEAIGPAFPFTGSSATFNTMVLGSDGNLIIGGRFTTSLGSPCIVKLNLTTQKYEPIGLGVTSGLNHVQKMAVYQDTLYVLGRFTQVKDSAKTLAVNNIARYYLKTNRWDSMGSGLADFSQSYQATWIPICGLDVSPTGEVFVGGNFTTIGNSNQYFGVASWKTGRGWDTVGSGVRAYNGTTPSRGIPYTLAYNPADSAVYVGGYVGYLQNAPFNNLRQNGIARYKNGKWAYNFGSFSALTYQTYYDSTTQSVFYGGAFARGIGAGNLSEANRIARFDRGLDSLMELNGGITSGLNISAMVRWQGKLYVAGDFNECDSSIKTLNLAAWDGSKWEPVGHGVDLLNSNTQIKTFTKDKKGNLLVGGNFRSLGGIESNGWARIDTNGTVTAMNIDLQSSGGVTQVNAILSVDDSMYVVGGRFIKTMSPYNTAGIVAYNENSKTWSNLGASGVATIYQYVNCIAKVGNKIVVGGYFTAIGGVAANNLAYWDGTSWHAMGDPDGEVEHFTVYQDSILYVEGFFNTINGNTHKYIARYDNSTWRAVGAGLYSSPADIAVHPYTGELWLSITGSIPNTSGPSYSSTGYAVWDGTTWKDYGKLSGSVYGINSIYHAPDSTTYLTAIGISQISGNNASNVLRYHPNYGWAGTGSGIKRFSNPYTPDFYAMHTYNKQLYIGGKFEVAGDSIQASNLAAFALDNPADALVTLSLGKDTTAYYGYSIKATTSTNYDSLLWSTGTKNSSYANVFATGNYSAIVYNKGCAATDTVHITINGKNMYIGGSGDGAADITYRQYGTLKGGSGNGSSYNTYLQNATMMGGNGDGAANGIYAQYATLKGGGGDGSADVTYRQYGTLKGGSGDGAANGIVTDTRTIFKGGKGEGFSESAYLALPDGTVTRIISPLVFKGKDSVELSAVVHNKGDYPIIGFKVNWFVKGSLYAFKEFTDSIAPNDSLVVTASPQRFMPLVGQLPLDMCVLITNIAKEKETGNNQLCYILDKATSIIQATQKPFDIAVYPNPASNTTWLQITAADELESNFELINNEGKVVLKKQLDKGLDKIEIDVQQLPAGIYHFAYTRGSNKITGKIAVVK